MPDNAARHGAPSAVRLSVERRAAGRGEVALLVEDDGGGDPAGLESRAGNGLLGIRERIQSLGGSLIIGPAAGGVRIAAILPLPAPGFSTGVEPLAA